MQNKNVIIVTVNKFMKMEKVIEESNFWKFAIFIKKNVKNLVRYKPNLTAPNNFELVKSAFIRPVESSVFQPWQPFSRGLALLLNLIVLVA